MGLVVDVGSGQKPRSLNAIPNPTQSSQSLANRRSRAEAAPHSHSQSQEPTAPNPMGVPLKNGVEAAPDSEDEAWTIPSQQWHTGEPNPFDSRYGGSKLDLVVPAACMIRIEMGCRCCLLRKLWDPSSPIQRLREMPSDGSGSRLYLVDEIPSVYVSDYRSSVQCGGTSNTGVMYGMRDVDAKPILFCHRAFSSCVSIGENNGEFKFKFLVIHLSDSDIDYSSLISFHEDDRCVGNNFPIHMMVITMETSET
ncbi:hypothetical protein HN873_038324 [Arachis hypogaea]